VRIGFEELDPRILPDMGVKVSFLTERPAAESATPRVKLVVPSSAVRNADGRSIVFVLRDGRAERRAIAVGAAVGDQVEVLSGVSAGEQVVVDGPQTLKDGDKVKVQ